MDQYKTFALTFSVAVGSLVLLIINILFNNGNIFTPILIASTAINVAFLFTLHKEETVKLLRKLTDKN